MPDVEVTEHTAGRMLATRSSLGKGAKRSAYLMAEAHWRGAVEHQDTASVLFWARVKELLK